MSDIVIRIEHVYKSFGEEEVPMVTEADYQAFFERLDESKTLPATSQPSPELYLAF